MTPQEAYDALISFTKSGGGAVAWYWDKIEISKEGSPVDQKGKPTGWPWHCALKCKACGGLMSISNPSARCKDHFETHGQRNSKKHVQHMRAIQDSLAMEQAKRSLNDFSATVSSKKRRSSEPGGGGSATPWSPFGSSQQHSSSSQQSILPFMAKPDQVIA